MAIPIVHQLQADAANPKVPVSDLLRLAKIVASKLDLGDALEWIDAELDGYQHDDAKECPPYRKVMGTPKAFDPYRGWHAIQFDDGEMARMHSTVVVGQSIGSLEETLRRANGTLAYSYPHGLKQAMQKALKTDWDITRFVDHGQLAGIPDAVRNLVLDWSLKLEKAGVIGEGTTFSKNDIGEAKNVTQQFFIQNVGVLGNVNDHALVKNQQTATVALNLSKVLDFVNQTKGALCMLPDNTKGELALVIDQIEFEAKAAKPDEGKLKGLLSSAKAIAEGATGNLAASGILALLANLF
jgi:AbiTii